MLEKATSMWAETTVLEKKKRSKAWETTFISDGFKGLLINFWRYEEPVR